MNYYYLFLFLILLNSPLAKTQPSHDRHPLQPLKIALTSVSPQKEELYILVVNRNKKSFYNKSITVTINDKSYTGDIYSKQMNSYNLHQAIHSGEMGVIVISLQDHRWPQCEKLAVRLDATSNDKLTRPDSKRQTTYLRLHDSRYASTCTHLD